MSKCSILIIFCLLVKSSTADLCSYNFSVSDLPNSIVGEMISLIWGNFINDIDDCSNLAYSEKNIKFWLYTRNNPSVPIQIFISNTSMLNGRKTIVLAHGWLCNTRNEEFPALKDAYLTRYDANIVMIDWSFYSLDYYANCYCHVKKVAETAANFLCKADLDMNININQLHILGHSMGGHLAGLIGQKVQRKCVKLIKRISALDLAGPLYNGKNESERLDASDAEEVMVCHSNMAILGYLGNCGTADYYPNMGYYQNGCSVFNAPTSSLLDKLMYPVFCSHLRCVSYMVESISSNNFKGKNCLSCGGCVENPFTGFYGTMGEDYTAPQKDCGYYMDTNSEAPFGQG